MNTNYNDYYYNIIEEVAFLEYLIEEEEQRIKYDSFCDIECSYFYISSFVNFIDEYKSELILLGYNKDIIDFDVVHNYKGVDINE